MSNSVTNIIGMDVDTDQAKAVVRALRRLKSTYEVVNAGAYVESREYCQVYIRTTKTEEELDAWADGTAIGQAIVGFFTVSESTRQSLFQ